MSVNIIHFFKMIHIQDQKAMKAFRSFFSQNSIDHLLRILSVINACKRILLGRTYQFRFLLVISYNNIQEQEKHQNTEASHK